MSTARKEVSGPRGASGKWSVELIGSAVVVDTGGPDPDRFRSPEELRAFAVNVNLAADWLEEAASERIRFTKGA